MSDSGYSTGGGSQQHNIATAIAEVSERASILVREEIELAKAEIAEKGKRLARGAVVGAAAGVFVLTALFFVLVGCAWLLYYALPIGNQFTYFYGFFAMAIILLILGAIAGLIAAKAVKAGAPPTPTMAIDEARKIRETVSSTTSGAGVASYGIGAASAAGTTGVGAAGGSQAGAAGGRGGSASAGGQTGAGGTGAGG